MDGFAINSISDFRKAMRNGPFAWPGGYPCYFITTDGCALSYEAAKDNRRAILEAIRDADTYSGWGVTSFGVNWEDTNLYCEHTGKRIPSAYGEDN